MRYSCDLIRDLLPLYCDGVASSDSAAAVEEHLRECEDCKAVYEGMRQPVAGDLSAESEVLAGTGELAERQLASMRAVQKKIRKKNRWIGVAGIVLGGVLAVVVMRVLILMGLVGLLALDSARAKIEVHGIDEIARYQEFIGKDALRKYGGEFNGKWDMDESVFPEQITDEKNVRDFKFIYYNPWDAEYVAYLTVDYAAEDYEKECARLAEKGTDAYLGYYGVTGAPAGYELLAMKADSYHGFVYAVTPEGDSTTVTYVMAIFCNYQLDFEIEDYVPKAYLLSGFDAGEDNPYQLEQKMKK